MSMTLRSRRRRAGPAEPAERKRRHIVFLMWRDSSHPEGGGSEMFVERVAEYLSEQGWDVTICCAAYPGAVPDEARNGMLVRRRGGRLTVYLHGFAYLLGGHGRKADIVVDVQNGVPFFSRLVRRRDVLVLVHHVHREQWQIIYPGLIGHFGWWLESRLAPRLYRGSRYVTVSDASRHDLIGLGVEDNRIDLVHNGIDVPHPEHLLARSPVPTVCVLGRLVPHKQVEHALEVASRARGAIPDLHMDVVGDGWWREPLQDRAVELGVDDIVTFHGGLGNAERDAILDRAWIMLVPSVKEGWGIAIMEAAARGVPTLAYASAGGVCESIVNGETGWLADDLDGLTKHAEELLTDHALREQMGAHARERAARFDWRSTGRRFNELLERELGR
jgi:glycosyltransferase involved in cell wall biosynthesis